eukprot:CAMPEP_0116870974 /NCGR_PEP_ID=MMETSP0463-20121206/1128_1 /TAXON_ID=181622 /ORGANISM="Strombidinopsis sp, Strain SopsisLIS2011" /LENGTH=58 /DNA_ID=CAMNT_0004508539 /DNA_START=1678 /DNA_END=1850 /DNA_ORIENTATION=-
MTKPFDELDTKALEERSKELRRRAGLPEYPVNPNIPTNMEEVERNLEYMMKNKGCMHL